MRATVTAFMRSIASAISRPASAPARRCSGPGSSAAKADTSAPALKERPFPLTTTTLTSGWLIEPAGGLGELDQRPLIERVQLLGPVQDELAAGPADAGLDRREPHGAP